MSTYLSRQQLNQAMAEQHHACQPLAINLRGEADSMGNGKEIRETKLLSVPIGNPFSNGLQPRKWMVKIWYADGSTGMYDGNRWHLVA